jgi:hypothetical protein
MQGNQGMAQCTRVRGIIDLLQQALEPNGNSVRRIPEGHQTISLNLISRVSSWYSTTAPGSRRQEKRIYAWPRSKVKFVVVVIMAILAEAGALGYYGTCIVDNRHERILLDDTLRGM